MGLQAAGDEHGGAGDKAVHQNHAALSPGLQHGAHHGGDFVAAERCQRIKRCGSGGVHVQRLLQHGAFALDTGSVQPGARAGAFGQ